MLKRIFLLLIVSVIAFTSLSGCIKAEKKGLAGNEPVFEYGNTSGNNSNNGRAAVNGNWIYYITESDGMQFCKIHTDGTEKTLLNVGWCRSINAVGDCIYYINGTDKINKIRVDDDFQTEILSGISFSSIHIVNDWVFYTESDTNTGLHRIRLDGKGKKRLLKTEPWDYFVLGNTVYYCNLDSQTGLFSMSTDGKEKKKLSDDEIAAICAEGDFIYYINSSNGNTIWKIRTDGTEKNQIIVDRVSSINVSDGWIYYSNDSDNSYLYKIRTDGTEKTLLNNEDSSNINIAGEWIFYNAINERMQTCKIHKDGTGRQLV